MNSVPGNTQIPCEGFAKSKNLCDFPAFHCLILLFYQALTIIRAQELYFFTLFTLLHYL